MTKYRLILLSAAAAFVMGLPSSCVGDLNVEPIDPTVTLPENVLNSEEAYAQLLAKCYAGLSVSSSEGENGSPDIEGIDGGYGQYLRALFYMNEYTTDEAVCPWNDQTIRSLHGLSWTSSDVFVTAMFSRIYFQIGLCNEFLRRAMASELVGSETMQTYMAEARALRLLSYYHAIDMFGNVPNARETDPVGDVGPEQISRADLFEWLLSECRALREEGHLKPVNGNVYGRLDEGFVMMLEAKLNLNAAVYLGISDSEAKSYFDACATVCKEIKDSYPALHDTYSELFMADNDTRTDEIIFNVPQDGVQIRTYGGTNFIIKSSIAGQSPDWWTPMGVNDGWGGIMVTPEFIGKFDNSDVRKMFWGGGPGGTYPSDISDISDFKSGWTAYKFTNARSDGQSAQDVSFPDTDFPLFRTADAYLMLAEARLRGATTVTDTEAQEAWNAVRTRAGLSALASSEYTLDEMLDERGRELYWECWRRSDLVRFGKFTSGDYLWRWKGNVYMGTGVDSKFNLMPIPSNEINSNGKLTQNAGY